MSTEVPIFEGVDFKIFHEMLGSRTYLRLQRARFHARPDMIEVEIPENLKRVLLIPTPEDARKEKRYAVVIHVSSREQAQKVIDKIVPVIERPCDIYGFKAMRYTIEG